MPSEFAAFSSTCLSCCDTGTYGIVHRTSSLSPYWTNEEAFSKSPTPTQPVSAAQQATTQPLSPIFPSCFLPGRKSLRQTT